MVCKVTLLFLFGSLRLRVRSLEMVPSSRYPELGSRSSHWVDLRDGWISMMGGSSLDRAHKNGIGAAYIPGKVYSTIGKNLVRFVSSHVSRDFDTLLLELFSTASVHGNKE
eukprot:1158786-Pelagomonas_calceolata.AAC.15